MRILRNLPVTQLVNFTVKFIIWMLLLLLMMMEFPNWRHFLLNSTFPQEKKERKMLQLFKKKNLILGETAGARKNGLKCVVKGYSPSRINESPKICILAPRHCPTMRIIQRDRLVVLKATSGSSLPA